MKHLIIIGARGFGREIYNLAIECDGYGRDFIVTGFLDDKSDALDGYEDYPSILGAVEDYNIQENDIFVCALGDVFYKKKYVQMVLDKNGEFMTLIHPNAYISKNVKVGTGCIICRNALISCDITIGDFVTIQPFSDLGHDVRVGDYCHLNTYAFLGGYAELGEMVTIHTGGIVLPHKKINDKATVGAGSVVIRNVKEEMTVFGLPAVKI